MDHAKAKISAHNSQMHYSTKFFKGYYRYLIANFDESLFDQACTHFKVDKTYLLSDNEWVSHDFLKSFRDYLKEITGDDQISYHMGQSFLSTQNINPFEKVFLKTMPPSIFFRIFSFTSKKINKVSEYRVIKNGIGHVVIQLDSPGRYKHNRDVCLNALGIFEGFKEGLGLDSVEVRHTECIHQNGTICRFEFRYSSRTQWMRRLSIAGVMAGLGFISWWLGRHLPLRHSTIQYLMSAVTIGFSLFGALTYFTLEIFRNYFVHVNQNVSKNAEIHQKRARLEYRDHESILLRDLSLKLNQGLTPNEIIQTSLTELHEKFAFPRVVVMLHNPGSHCLYTQDLRGFDSASEREMLLRLRLKYPNPSPDKKDLFANILDGERVQLIQNLIEFSNQLENPENQQMVNLLRVNSLVVAPIYDSENKYGLFILGSLKTDQQLDSYDRELMVKVSQLISIAFKNSKNLEKQKQLTDLFKKYVPAMILDQNIESAIGATTSTEIVSFFCDLRDFTQTSQNLRPEQVKIMLDIYIDYITTRIARFGGVIDKLLGDGVNAFFIKGAANLDSEIGDYRERAFRSSAAILSEMSILAEQFRERGLPQPKVGIGLNAGPAFVGSFGSALKMDYSAIGDTVNVAARLQGMAKELGKEILKDEQSLLVVSETVMSSIIKFSPAAVVEREIRGRSGATRISVFTAASLTAPKAAA